MIVGNVWTVWVRLIEFWKKNFRISDTKYVFIKYVEYVGKTRFSKYCRFLVPNRSWSLVNTHSHLTWTIICFRIIVSEMRKFYFQNSIRRPLTVQMLPTITHYVRRIINSRLFRSVFLDFLQNFFATWKLLSELNSSPRERSNRTRIIQIDLEKPFQTLFCLA